MKTMFQLGLLANFALWPALALAQAPGGSASPPPSIENRPPQSPLAKCLPDGIRLGEVVEAAKAGNANGQPASSHQITVEQKLNDLKASCNSENKLVDGNGRQIVFYHLTGCWGYPPPNYRELLQKQRGEIERLKQQYTVIEMTCNPSGAHISSLTKSSGVSLVQVKAER